MKSASHCCRKFRGEGSRQDGKVKKKKEKCKRGTVHRDGKRKEMTDEQNGSSPVRKINDIPVCICHII